MEPCGLRHPPLVGAAGRGAEADPAPDLRSPGAPPVHANRRAIAASADAQEEARAAEFVRRKLFPWDTALHRHVCVDANKGQ